MTAEFRSTHRYARVAVGKARPIMDVIRMGRQAAPFGGEVAVEAVR